MENIEALRRAVYDLAAKKLGRDARQPRQISVQLTAAESMAIIMALPVDDNNFARLQNTSTGAMLFMMDGDGLDGTAIG